MPIFEPVFQVLTDAWVEHMVIGGIGVVLHGHVRLTEDLDLVIHPAQIGKAIEALTELGLNPQLPEPMSERLSLSDTAARRFVDIFTELPIPFSTMHAERISLPLAGTTTAVASIPHLIALKRMTNTPMDRIDIDDLDTIARERAQPIREGPSSPDDWGDLSYEGARLSLLRRTMAWSPIDRMRRMEDLIEFAYQAGALPRRKPQHP